VFHPARSARLSLRWAYKPCGPPPSAKEPLVLRVLCSAGIPLGEDIIKEILGEGEEYGYE